MGSLLHPEIIRRGLWSDIWLEQGSRRCRVSSSHLSCYGETGEFTVECSSVDAVVGLALRFLQELATPDEVATDARIVRRRREPLEES